MDIGHWLDTLGLGRYRNAFRANDIEQSILPSLTADDLREIGITSVGHRRKLLEAIGALTSDPAPAPPPPETAAPERRQLTVLFADLIGSTEMSARLDPEEMGALLTAYQNAVAAQVAQSGGHVAKFMGDGVLAYFGWPHADEDAAERAARAGLAMVRAVADLPEAGTRLECRVGIATGLVVVGELIGERAAREELVVGETPNLAARLQSVARPGQVLVAPFTRDLLGEAFALKALAPQALKGFREPITAWLVRGEAPSVSRFQAKRGRSLLPLIGREGEHSTLLSAWEGAKAGQGSTWLVTGLAGIGKSRLVEAVVADALAGADDPIQLQCSPFQGDTALHPVIRYVTLLAGIDPAAPFEAQQAQIDRALTRYGHAAELAPLLGWLVGLQAGEPSATPSSPRDTRRMALKALVGLIHTTASRDPVLLIVEDVHWADPTTLELIGRVSATLQAHRVLMILTSRPELPQSLVADDRLKRLDLDRLSNAATLEIATRVAGAAPLPEALLAEIARRTDGVPLFVEELTKSMLESRGRDDGVPRDPGMDPAATDDVTIPATLHDSLMVRLDRLGPVKAVAQTAAVIGRSFRRNLLQRLLKIDPGQLDAALDRLQQAELIFTASTGGKQRLSGAGVDGRDTAFEFKHALVRDAAYESLLKRTRRGLHAQLYHLLAVDPESAPALVARHAELGDLRPEAMAAWERAGALALARPAYVEATAAFGAAIRVCQGLPQSTETQRQELRLTNRLGLALMGAMGYQAEPVGKTFQRALKLAEQIGDPELVFPAVFGLCTHRYTAGQPFASFGRLVNQAHALLESLNEKSRRLNAPRVLALQSVREFHGARFEAALIRVDQICAVYDSDLVSALVHRYGEDSRITATGYRAWALSFLGQVDAARDAVATAVGWARELDHAASLAMALLNGAARNAIWLRDTDLCMAAAAEALQLARRHTLPLWENYAKLHLGLAIAQRGKAAEVAMLADGLDQFLNSGVRMLETANLTLLAEAQLRLGDHPGARRTLASARAAITRAQDLPFEPDLARAEARLALADGADRQIALARLRHALAVARSQGARLPALRAATDLAQLLADIGEPVAAQVGLARELAGFSEPVAGLADLAAARSLSDTLK